MDAKFFCAIFLLISIHTATSANDFKIDPDLFGEDLKLKNVFSGQQVDFTNIKGVPAWWKWLLQMLEKELDKVLMQMEGYARFFNVSEQCINDTGTFVNGATKGKMWALKMLDSFGKPPSGLIQGNLAWLGSFSQCMAVVARDNSTGENMDLFHGKYCGLSLYSSASKLDRGTSYPLHAFIGTCLPNSCSSNDSVKLYSILVGIVFSSMKMKQSVFVVPALMKCSVPLNELEWKPEAVAMMTVVSVFAALMLVGTLMDLYLLKLPKDNEIAINIVGENNAQNAYRNLSNVDGIVNEEESIEPHVVVKFLLAFSIYTNGKKLLSTAQPKNALSSVHGIRFISMTWVILGHTYVFGMNFIGNKVPQSTELMNRWTFQAVMNATVSVDTFFILSGLLVTYLFFGTLEKVQSLKKINWPMYYFHRFWRLSPAYFLMIGVNTALVVHFTNGPFWDQVKGLDPNCRNHWWRNILYINNFFPQSEMCFGWSWYLANDMQFYILSPIVLIPLALNIYAGLAVVSVLVIVCLTTRGIISSANNLTMVTGETGTGEAFTHMYMAFYSRMATYLIGMVTGYLLHKYREKIRLRKWAVLLGWMLAAFCCLIVIYGPYDVERGKVKVSGDVAALYNSTHRFLWSLGVCWVIFACVNGYAGFINSFLSWKVFVPLGRLTYCAYLVHPIVMFTVYLTREAFLIWDDTYTVYFFLSHVVVSYAFAFIVSLAFESPFMGIEKAFFRR